MPPESSISKTFSRGLRALEFIAANSAGVTLADVAKHLGVHRTIAHRLVGTLELHHLVRRSDSKIIVPAAGLIRLAESVDRDVRTVARPLLQMLADELGATANLVATVSESEVQAIQVVEPTRAEAHIAFRVGQTNPIDRGSAGIAILASRPPMPDERPQVTSARKLGYAVSRAEIIPSAWGISVAVPTNPQMPDLSIGVTLFDDERIAEIAPVVARYADELSRLFGSAAA